MDELYAAARERGAGSLASSLLSVLNVTLVVNDRDLKRIPACGPVVTVSNHPFGLLDGIILDHLVQQVRPDIKVLSNSLLCSFEELKERIIPVDVFADQKATDTNLRAVRRSMQVLKSGGGLAIFPAGEVSHWQRAEGRVTDPPWSTLAVRCARAAVAPVVPIFFSGENSLTFHLAAFLHPRLRTVRLPGELINKRGHRVEVRIGAPVRAEELAKFDSGERATGHLRARTYMLSHRGETAKIQRCTSFSRLERSSVQRQLEPAWLICSQPLRICQPGAKQLSKRNNIRSMPSGAIEYRC